MRLFNRLVVRKRKLKLYAVTHISYICTILQVRIGRGVAGDRKRFRQTVCNGLIGDRKRRGICSRIERPRSRSRFGVVCIRIGHIRFQKHNPSVVRVEFQHGVRFDVHACIRRSARTRPQCDLDLSLSGLFLFGHILAADVALAIAVLIDVLGARRVGLVGFVRFIGPGRLAFPYFIIGRVEHKVEHACARNRDADHVLAVRRLVSLGDAALRAVQHGGIFDALIPISGQRERAVAALLPFELPIPRHIRRIAVP